MNNHHDSMVYLTKVFSDETATASPLLSQLTADSSAFTQQLTLLDQQGRGRNNVLLPITEDTEFVIDSTEVIITDFDLSDPSGLTRSQITVDGCCVDDVEVYNQRYMATTNDLMTRIGDCSCMERGASTRGYLLINAEGGWNTRMSIVIRGTAFGCGSCNRFKLTMTTRDAYTIDIPGASTFASDCCMPCTTGGIAPIINFSFDAAARLLNPVLTAGEDASPCALTLTGTLITEPEAEIQVTRQTLFNIPAESINLPCDDLEKCRQASRTCDNGVDDASGAYPIQGRCCGDGDDEDNDDDDNDCGCGGNNIPHARARTSVTCQFNGCNGCNL